MQELEKILEEIKAHRNFASECGNFNVASAFELCVEIIRKHISGRDMNVSTNDGWIPVEEQMPENEGFYLVTFFWSREVSLLGYGSCKRNIKWEPIGFGWYDISTATYLDDNSVIAWRPLPEPYRPERSEE